MRTRCRPVSLIIALSFVLTACGGGGGGSVVPPGSNGPIVQGGSTASLVLSGSIESGSAPQLLAKVRRAPFSRAKNGAHALATLVFNHITVVGTLFPGDAGASVIQSSTNIPVPSGTTFKASVPFSNVPVHNNEWAVLQFEGVATDGSLIALGELAGLINVAATSTNSATLTTTSTQTFQVFELLLNNGEIGTFDLDNTPALNAALAADVAATHVAPDVTTGLFNTGQLQSIFNVVAPKFERNLSVTASGAAGGSVVILKDYTNAAELALAADTQAFFTFFTLDQQLPKIGEVLGGSLSCGGFSDSQPAHIPKDITLVPAAVISCILPNGTGIASLRNVYGGHLLIGVTTNPYAFNLFGLPVSNGAFKGAYVKQSGTAAGATASLTAVAASTSLSISVNDPAGFAFGAPFFSQGGSAFSMSPNFGTQPLSATQFSNFAAASNFRITIPTPYSATSHTLTVDTFNPWDIAPANLQICGGINCYPLNAPQPLQIVRPLADAGTKLTFFKWAVSGVAHAISQKTGGGYSVSVSGAGTGTLSTVTPSALTPRQRIVITNSFPSGTVFTITAKDAAGNTYQNSAVNASTFGIGSASITMDSVGNQITTKSIALSFTATGPGAFILNSIGP